MRAATTLCFCTPGWRSECPGSGAVCRPPYLSALCKGWQNPVHHLPTGRTATGCSRDKRISSVSWRMTRRSPSRNVYGPAPCQFRLRASAPDRLWETGVSRCLLTGHPPHRSVRAALPAYGSCLGCLTAKRMSGQGCTIRGFGEATPQPAGRSGPMWCGTSGSAAAARVPHGTLT
jgi:hypothetical protein